MIYLLTESISKKASIHLIPLRRLAGLSEIPPDSLPP